MPDLQKTRFAELLIDLQTQEGIIAEIIQGAATAVLLREVILSAISEDVRSGAIR